MNRSPTFPATSPFGGWSEIGLGGWQLGGARSDRAAYREALGAVDHARSLGINWIDTAPIYGRGRAETMVGKLAASRPGIMSLATKCGHRWSGTREFDDWSKAGLADELAASCRRLGVGRVDLLQLHHPATDRDLGQVWSDMAALREAGRCAHIGVCNLGVAQLERLAAIELPASVQVSYSLLDRAVESDVLPWCREHGVPVLAYGTLGQGRLTASFSADTWPAGDWRRSPELVATFARAVKLRQALAVVAGATGRTVEQTAVGWALGHPAVSAAIVGVRTRAQAQACLYRWSPEAAAEVRSNVEAACG